MSFLVNSFDHESLTNKYPNVVNLVNDLMLRRSFSTFNEGLPCNQPSKTERLQWSAKTGADACFYTRFSTLADESIQ